MSEQEIPTDQPLAEKILEQRKLFHGSTVSGIRAFDRAEEDTLGAGVYLTTANAAMGYAHHRAKHEGKPVLYRVEVATARLIDLTDAETAEATIRGFRPVLVDEHARHQHDLRHWNWTGALQQMIEEIDSGRGLLPGMTKVVTQRSGELFTEHLQKLGFDGVFAREGGEGNIGNHDTYLIFDPAKLRITGEMDLTDQFAEKPAPGATHDVAGDIHQGITAALSIRRPSPTEAARHASGARTSRTSGLADGVAAEIEHPTATSEATI